MVRKKAGRCLWYWRLSSVGFPICLLAAVLAPATRLALAKEPVQQHGTILTMNSVPCGSKSQGRHKNVELLCHQYVLRAGNLEYHIQQKEAKNAALLSLGQDATFTLRGDVMRLRAADANGKVREFDFTVVSMQNIAPEPGAPSPPPSANLPPRLPPRLAASLSNSWTTGNLSEGGWKSVNLNDGSRG